MPARLLARLSLRARLTLAFAGLMVVLFGGLALALHQQLAASLDDGLDRALHNRAAAVSRLIRGHDLGRLAEALPLADSVGVYAQVIDARGRVVDATPGHTATPLLAAAEVREALRAPLRVDRRDDARILAQPLRSSPPGVLVVAGSLAQHDQALTTLGQLLFIGGPVLLVVVCLAGYALADRALAPVERMRARAAMISDGGRGERLPLPESRDELRRLGETLNEMLGRLGDALRRERAFVENAGHELRTPLSILKLELELALSDDPTREDLEAALRSTAEEVDRLARLAEDLLVIARVGQGLLPVHKRPLDVDGALRVVAHRVEGAARSRGRTVAVGTATGLVVAADRERLEQALTNMVVNALRHGAGHVALAAREDGDRVELHVLDEGPGFDPAFLELAFERLAGAPAERPGRGLGLSIVRAVAEAHGGEAHAANRPSGGADVWVSLPRGPGAAGAPAGSARGVIASAPEG